MMSRNRRRLVMASRRLGMAFPHERALLRHALTLDLPVYLELLRGQHRRNSSDLLPTKIFKLCQVLIVVGNSELVTRQRYHAGPGCARRGDAVSRVLLPQVSFLAIAR